VNAGKECSRWQFQMELFKEQEDAGTGVQELQEFRSYRMCNSAFPVFWGFSLAARGVGPLGVPRLLTPGDHP
jgi:hypothetical protein